MNKEILNEVKSECIIAIRLCDDLLSRNKYSKSFKQIGEIKRLFGLLSQSPDNFEDIDKAIKQFKKEAKEQSDDLANKDSAFKEVNMIRKRVIAILEENKDN